MVKRIVEKDVARRVKTVNDKLPFKEAGDTKVRRPISMHGKQRAWIINGLRHLKAPTAAWRCFFQDHNKQALGSAGSRQSVPPTRI